MQATHDAWRQTKRTSATVAHAPLSLVRMLGRFGGPQRGSGSDLFGDEEDVREQALLGERPQQDEFVHSYR